MDDEQLEPGAPPPPPEPTVEDRARTMGWSPQEKWRGNPNDWVDAAEFIERGERVMPVLRANARALEDKVVNLERTNQELNASIQEMRSSMSEFADAQRDLLRERLSTQKADIRRQLREAREAGDEDAIERLEESLDENKEQSEKLKETDAAPPVRKAASPPPPPNPAYEAWVAANSWYGAKTPVGVAKTSAATSFGQQAASQGLKGKAFFDFVDEHMAEAFPTAPPAPNKVEPGRPSGTGAATGDAKFSALPADAQAQARADSKRFVGPNKMFKTEKEWFSHFTKLYGA